MVSKVNPKHYDMMVNGHPLQVVDIMEAFFPQDVHLGQAVKYLLRAGRKGKSSYLEDVGKCLWWCAKAIMYHKGTVELPEGALTKPEAIAAGQICIEAEPDNWHRVEIICLPIDTPIKDVAMHIVGVWTREDTVNCITDETEIQPIYTERKEQNGK